MIFFSNSYHSDIDDEEEKEGEEGIDDALIGELDDGVEDEEELLAELDPLLKVNAVDPLAIDEEEGVKEEGAKVFEDEDDEEVDDYDSFDDRDEM